MYIRVYQATESPTIFGWLDMPLDPYRTYTYCGTVFQCSIPRTTTGWWVVPSSFDLQAPPLLSVSSQPSISIATEMTVAGQRWLLGDHHRVVSPACLPTSAIHHCSSQECYQHSTQQGPCLLCSGERKESHQTLPNLSFKLLLTSLVTRLPSTQQLFTAVQGEPGNEASC